MNIGVILYCQADSFLELNFHVSTIKLSAFPKIDIETVKRHCDSYQKLCKDKGKGSLLDVDLSTLFDWLTAPRSTVIQFSDVREGLCEDADLALRHIMQKLVY
jgi:hypothetical protein